MQRHFWLPHGLRMLSTMLKQNYMVSTKWILTHPILSALSPFKIQLKISLENNVHLTQWTLAWCLASAAENLNKTHSEGIRKLCFSKTVRIMN